MKKYRITYKRLQGNRLLDYVHMTIEGRNECPKLHENKVLKEDKTIKEFISKVELVDEPVMMNIDEDVVPYNPNNDIAKYFEDTDSKFDFGMDELKV